MRKSVLADMSEETGMQEMLFHPAEFPQVTKEMRQAGLLAHSKHRPADTPELPWTWT